ncbi:MAG TPA: hypothetical protein VNE62_07675 [Actinomycetota bacterium]|nr:hypothetical protein [Actinomycetota bacterium]
MNGFWVIAAIYAGLWMLLLAPGAFLIFSRERAVPLPESDPLDERWVRTLRRQLLSAAPESAIPAADLRLRERPRKPRGAGEESVKKALRLKGRCTVQARSAVGEALVVEGPLRCEAGSVLLAPVWVRGDAVLDEEVVASSMIVDGSLSLGKGTRIEGRVAAGGAVRLAEGAQVTGPVFSKLEVELSEGSRVAAALAPVVSGAPAPDAPEVLPPSEASPLERPHWTPELDRALEESWSADQRLAQIIDSVREATGVLLRGVHVLERARELGLFARGIPRRPAVLARRPAWVLEPETIRVGADLRVPPGVVVSYTLALEGSLEVFQDAVLEAPVRSGRGILLHARSAVYGQAVSDGLIVLEEGTAVLGPLDSSTHILLFCGARAGVPGFGGANARGAIGLEPGARIMGGAVGGLGVRGEPARPEAERRKTVDALPGTEELAAMARGKRRRRMRGALRRRKKPSRPPMVPAQQAPAPEDREKPASPRAGEPSAVRLRGVAREAGASPEPDRKAGAFDKGRRREGDAPGKPRRPVDAPTKTKTKSDGDLRVKPKPEAGARVKSKSGASARVKPKPEAGARVKAKSEESARVKPKPEAGARVKAKSGAGGRVTKSGAAERSSRQKSGAKEQPPPRGASAAGKKATVGQDRESPPSTSGGVRKRSTRKP